MTDDLGRDIDAREDLEQVAQADGTVGGADGSESLVGQAETVIGQPAAGETVTIVAAAGQQYLVQFDPEQAQVRVQGNNLILHFPDGGEVVIQGLGSLVNDPNPPVFEIADQPVSGAVIFTQAAAQGEGPFITAAEPEVAGTGATQYSDDHGNLIDLLNPQGVIPGTELAFHLIDLQPTEVLLGTNPPVDYDLDVTAHFFTSFADAGLTFAPGLGFGGGTAPTPPLPGPVADLLLVAAAAPTTPTNSLIEYDGSDANAFFGDSLLSPNPGGLQIQEVTYTGDNTAASHFSGVNFGSINGITFGLGSGFLLTSGDGTPALSNTSNGASTDSAGGHDPDLINLVGSANDSSVVEITFTVPVGTNAVSLDFMFGSEEFPEYINAYPDIAAVFVDGVNYAYFNGDPGQRLNINTASVGNFYATGSGQHANQAGAGALTIEYDGISRPLRLVAQLGEGTNNGDGTETHTLKIAVADTGDSALDSGLFVSNLQVANGGTGGIGDIPSEDGIGGGFLYEFQVGEKDIVTDNIHGTDVEDGVTTHFTITSLPHDSNGNPVGYLLIDRGDDNVIDQIVGPGFDSAPVDVQTGDSVWYFLPKSDFAERPDVVTFNYFTTDSDGLTSLNDGAATVTIHLPDPVPTVTATDSMVDEDDLDGGEGQVSFVFQEPGSDTLDLGNPPFDPAGQQPTTVSGTITANFSFDEPGTIKFTQATIDALKALGLTSSTVFGPSGEDHDAPLSYEISADGHTLTGFVDVVEVGDVTVFTVTLDPASSSGDFNYTFELVGSINHPDDAGENTSVLPIKFTVQDLNGDTAVGTINVTVVDDVPTIAIDGAEGAGASLKVWESGIPGGGGGEVPALAIVVDGGEGSSAQATATVVFGADGPEVDPVLGTDPNIVTPDSAVIAAIKLDLASIVAVDESGTGAEGGDKTLSSLNPDGSLSSGLTSGGLEVFLVHPLYTSGEFAGQPDPTRIVGYVKEPVDDGGEGPGFEQVTVFEASVNLLNFVNHSPDQADINFDLFRPLDHPDAGVDGAQTGDNDLFRLNLQVTVSDDDGDTSTLPVTVDIGDDGPQVFESQTALVDEDGLSDGIVGAAAGVPGDVPDPQPSGDGNEATFVGNLNISFGADGPGDISFAALDGQQVLDTDGHAVTSQGNPLVYRWDADTHTLTAVIEGQGEGGEGGDGGEQGFLVTWSQISADFQDSEILGQIIGLNGLPAGPEITVNTTQMERQDNSDATTLAGGRIVVAWDDDGAAGGPGVSAQVFTPDGQPLGGEIAVSTSTLDSVSDPIVTGLAGGGFVVTWPGTVSGSSTELAARVFDANGNSLSAEFQVSVPDGVSALNHEVTALTNGGFVVTWEDSSFSSTVVVDSLARVFDAAGNALTGAFPVSESTADLERMPDVTALSGGGFVVTWGSVPLGGSEFDVFARVFGADGAPATGDILLTTETDFAQDRPRVEALQNGGFAAVWQDNDDGSADVFARFFDASGAPQTGEITVNTTFPNFQGFSDISALANGNVLVTWRGNGVGDDDGLFARIFQQDGTAVTGEFRVNEDATGSLIETETDFVSLPDGGFVATWVSSDGIVGRVFDADGNPVTGDFPVNTTTEGFPFSPAGAAPISLGGGAPGDDHPVFEVQITDVQNGEYVLTLLDQVDHAAPEPGTGDENDTFIDLPFTVTDFDGDSANGTLNVQINDDSPVVQDITLTHDETPGVDNPDDVDPATKPAGLLAVLTAVFGGLVPDELGAATHDIAVNYGADGPGGIALDQVVDGTDSGLVDTATGRDILLFNGPDNTIVGRVAPAVPEGGGEGEGEGGEELVAQVAAPEGDVAFVIYLEGSDSGADLWFVQYNAVLHDNPNDPDEANPEPVGTVTDENGRETTIPLFDDESLQVTYTATDYDGDAVKGTATITIEDDGPTILDGAEGAIHLVHDESAGEQTGGIATPTEDNNDNDLPPAAVEPQVQAVEAWVSLLQGTTVDLTAIGGVHDTLREGINFDAGADGLGSVRLDTSALATGTATGLFATADGAPISYVAVDGGMVLGVAGYTGDDANGRPAFDRVVFSLHLDTTSTDLGAGEADFTFVQYEAVVHPLPGDGSGTPSTFDEGLADGLIDGRLNIGYVVADKDGDTVTATGDARIVVDIEDDGPTLTGQTEMGVVEEEQNPVPGGNEDTTSGVVPNLDGDTLDPANFDVTTNVTTGTVAGLVSFGADQPGTFTFSTVFGPYAGIFALSSGGELINSTTITGLGSPTETLSASVDGHDIFTLELQSNGAYTFTLLEPLDHEPPVSGAVENVLGIDFSGVIVATDGDGDTVALDDGSFVVKVIDDIPIANDDTNSVDADDTLTVLPDDGVLANDAFGADGPAAGGGVTGVVAGDGTPLDTNVGNEIDGAFGTLTLNADGSYSYEADPGEGGTDVFTYQITDADGDSTTATLTITIDGAEGAPTVENIFAIHDETPGVDLISDDTSNPLPGEISDQAIGLTLINASQKAIPFSFGSDGPGSIALDDVTDGQLANFGGQILTDTETGLAIRLFNGDNDTVIGRVSAPDGSSDPAGAIAFISYIDQTGTPTGPVNEPAADLWTAQYRAIQHDNPLDPDEANPEQPGTLTEKITFDGLATGAYDGTDGSIDGQFAVYGEHGSGPILVSGTNPLTPGVNAAVVFDTANPGSISAGFGTPNQDFGGPGTGSGGAAGSPFANNVPLGKLLVVSQQGSLTDGNGDGLVDTPFPQGEQQVTMSFDFSQIDAAGVTLQSITLLDIDSPDGNQGMVTLYGAGDAVLATIPVSDVGFNGVETLDLGDTAGVLRMDVTIIGSGGFDNIVFTRPIVPHDELISLDYTVTDSNGDQAFGTGTVTFEDDGPKAHDGADYLAARDPAISGDVTANDSFGVDGHPTADASVISYSYTGEDGLGNPITITIPTGVSAYTNVNGALQVNPDGTFTYDGPFSVGDKAGLVDKFTYVIQDGDGDTDTGTQWIRVYEPNASHQLGDDTPESLAGTSDSDFISGGGGGDTIDGQGGDDLLFGDAGDDTLTGGGGDDLMFGDDGADTFSFSLAANEGNDTIGDFSTAQGDVLSFTDVTDVNSDTNVDINDVVASFGKAGDTVTVDLQSGTTVTFTDVDNSINDLNDLATHSLINGGAGV